MKKLSKNDFVEIEYTGKIKDTGEVFDTNVKEEIKKLNLNINPGAIVICLGQSMILLAIDEFLIGKEIGNYSLALEAKKAFGERRRDLIKIMPFSIFKNQNTIPEKGMVFSFDNLLGKITAVSGGRVIVDFNNPLAGKEVIYELRVKRILENKDEKIKALMLAFFNKEFPFKLEDNKLTIETGKNSVGFIELFKPKFKEILNLDLEIREKAEEKKLAEEKEEKEKYLN